MIICKKEECYGCYACKNICPKNAIELVEDNWGYIYPKIDEKKCINCGKCKKICKKNNSTNCNISKECFSAYSYDDDVHKTSSSGGVAYEISKNIIKNNGIVYGVSSFVDKSKDISFCRIKNVAELKKIQGSKYVQAYIKKALKEVLDDLENKKKVLFIGTPCQVAGLKAFLNKEYDNLITIDIVCHGVMAQKMLFDEIKKEIDYVNFRGRHGFKIIAKEKGKVIYNKNKYESDYYFSFLKGIGYRERCYSCEFAQKKRIGDITIGDFWGKEDYKKKNGISLVLINTEKGRMIFNNIDTLSKEKEEISFAYLNNKQLVEPMQKPKKYEEYMNNIEKKGLKYALKKYEGKKYYIIKTKGFFKKIKDKVK